MVGEPIQGNRHGKRGDSATETARNIAWRIDLRMYGGSVVTPDGTDVAKTIDEMARAMVHLKWFDVESTDIDWSKINKDHALAYRDLIVGVQKIR